MLGINWVKKYFKANSKKNEYGVRVKNFGVVDKYVCRGAKPDKDGYLDLKKFGVGYHVNLIDYKNVDEAIAQSQLAKSCGMREYIQVGLSDKEKPKVSDLKVIFQFMREYGGMEFKVYISCKGGRHRSSLISSMYLVIVHNMDKKEAWALNEKFGWYGELGHQVLMDWFMSDEFDPEDYR